MDIQIQGNKIRCLSYTEHNEELRMAQQDESLTQEGRIPRHRCGQ